MTRNRFPVFLIAVLALVPGLTATAADVQTITHGREVDLEAHLVEGKYVLFDLSLIHISGAHETAYTIS